MFRIFLKKNNLKVIKSKDIRYFYSTSNYAGYRTGSLWGSCMNDKMDEINFYNLISDSVSILAIVDSSGFIHGRSLLWETDKGLYLDRCYLLNDIFKYGYIMYVYKEFNIKYYYDYIIDTSTLQGPSIKLMVKIRKSRFIEKAREIYKVNPELNFQVPYLDTFRFFELRSNMIYLYNSNNGDYNEVYYIYSELVKSSFDELLVVNIKKSDMVVYVDHYFSYFPMLYSSIPERYIDIKTLFSIHITLGNLVPVNSYPYSYKGMYILDIEYFNSEFQDEAISILRNINKFISEILRTDVPIYLVLCSYKFFSIGTDIDKVYEGNRNLSIYQVFDSFKDTVNVVTELYTHRALEYIVENYRVQVFYISKESCYALFISKGGININDICSIFKLVKSKTRFISYDERDLRNISSYIEGSGSHTVIEFTDPKVFIDAIIEED